jgi:hypothetical protein
VFSVVLVVAVTFEPPPINIIIINEQLHDSLN